MIKDVLIGVGIAWLSLTPEGKKARSAIIKKVTETYMLPKEEKQKAEEKSEAEE